MKPRNMIQLLLLAASLLLLQGCPELGINWDPSGTATSPPSAGTATSPTPDGGPHDKTILVSAQGGWQDAGISLTKGQTVRVTAEGTVTYSTVESAPNGGKCGPAGVGQTSWTKDKSVVKKWNHAALIARLVPVGEKKKKHLIGRGTSITVKRDGSLQFRLNDTATANNSGSFLVIASWQ